MANLSVKQRCFLLDDNIVDILNGVAVFSNNSVLNSEEGSYQSTKFSAALSEIGESEKESVVFEEKLLCSSCSEIFTTRREQIDHYKSDWHRLNLKRKVLGLPPVMYQAFLAMLDEEISSLSGSESSDSDIENPVEVIVSPEKSKRLVTKLKKAEARNESDSASSESNFLSNRQWVYMKNSSGQLIRMYRCLIQAKKDDLCDNDLSDIAQKMPLFLKWAVVMVSGGHFAAAVFDRDEMLVHKTFHHYTVRRKQGGSQSARDNQGNAPKSVGASLRRQQEAALAEDIRQLIISWSNHLNSCQRIFLRAVGHNRAFFFSKKEFLFDKRDDRIRNIPFPTRRPTLQEVQRVHQLLMTIEYIECPEKKQVPKETVSCESECAVNYDISNAVGIQEIKPLAQLELLKVDKYDAERSIEIKNETAATQNTEETFTSNMFDAERLVKDLESTGRESELCSIKEKKKKPRKAKEKPETSVEIITSSEVEEVDELKRTRDEIYTTCCVGDVRMLEEILLKQKLSRYIIPPDPLDTIKELKQCVIDDSTFPEYKRADIKESKQKFSEDCVNFTIADNRVEFRGNGSTADSDENVKEKLAKQSAHMDENNSYASLLRQALNDPLTSEGQRALHVASVRDHWKLIIPLLHAGADPALKDNQGKTAYVVANNKATRNEFRKFMAIMPDKYNYTLAQIPSPLTAEQELERKAKEAKKRNDQKKAKREKQKELKAEEQKKLEEESEKQKFLALSDREKRALMAERRFVKQLNDSGIPAVSLSRCWQCGIDITGKIPFEYNNFTFCTSSCLQKHRLSTAKK